MSKMRNKFNIFTIIFVCISPIIASYIFFYYIKPSKTINYGHLVSPQIKMPNFNIINYKTHEMKNYKNFSDFSGKWVLMIIGNSNCVDQCVKNLYTIRQLRLSQGKEASRIVPLWVILDNKDINPILTKAYNDNIAAVNFSYIQQKDISMLNNILSQVNNVGSDIVNNIYLIDPQQSLIMYYKPDNKPSGIIKDLTKLLKWSRIG